MQLSKLMFIIFVLTFFIKLVIAGLSQVWLLCYFDAIPPIYTIII
jgi:hypothetical protein